MVFDEAGTYQIEYTATDECGNTTNAERTVIVESPPTYRTVLYTDGTFIINESDRDEAHNIELHGAATNVYVPFDPNGATNVDKYIFATETSRPWDSEASLIKTVEFGSTIKPTSLRNWFYNLNNLESFDKTNLDTSDVTNMSSMFYHCAKITSVDLSNLDMSKVTTFANLFYSCSLLSTVNLENVNAQNANNMYQMFYECSRLTSVNWVGFNAISVTDFRYVFNRCSRLPQIDLSVINTSNVTNMIAAFRSCDMLTELDLSGFDTSNVTDMSNMFRECQALTTIYASSSFVVSQATSSSNMFSSCVNLVGGAGTVWSSINPLDKTYAHIDGGVSDPGYFTAKN